MPASSSKWILTGLAVLALLGAVVLGAGLWVKANAHRIGPLVGDAVERATGRRLTLSGSVRPIFALSPGLAAEDLTLANAPWASLPEMARIGRLEVRLALGPLLQGRVVFQRLVLEEADLFLEIDAAGRSNWSPASGAPSSPPEGAPPRAGLDLPNLTARRVRIDLRDGRPGARPRRLEIAALDLTDPGGGPTVNVRLEGTLDARPLKAAGRLGRLPLLLDPLQPWPVDLALDLAGVRANASGTIQRLLDLRGVALQVEFRETTPGELKKVTGWRWLPDGAPLTVRGHLEDPAPGTWRLTDLELGYPPSDLAGALEIQTDRQPVRLAGRLTARHLDLRPFFPPPAKDSSAARAFSDAPLHLAGLRTVDLALDLTAGEIRLPHLAADQAGLRLDLSGGRLDVALHRSRVGEGRLAGRLVLRSMAGPGGAFELKLEGRRLDVDELLRDLGRPVAVSGDLDASLNVRGRGSSVAGMMATLHGQVSLLMGQGTLDSGSLHLLGADLATAFLRLVNPVRGGRPEVDINCFVCRLEAVDGQVAAKALFWDTASMTVFGEGGLDLRTERLDLGLRPVPKRGIANFSLSLGELTQPFRLGGTLAAPSLVVDRTRTAVTVGKAVGGTLLLGPIGAAAALLSTPRGEDNPCIKALAAAEEAPPPSAREPGPARRATDAVKEGAKGLGRSLKDMLGR